MNRAKFVAILSFVTLLVACSGGNEVSNTQSAYLRTLYDASRDNRPSQEREAQQAQETAALLQSSQSVLEVVVAATGQRAFLAPYSNRTSQTGRPIRVWRSADNAQIILQDDLLIATRGLGHNLISSSANRRNAIGLAGAGAGASFDLEVSDGGNRAQTISMRCAYEQNGQKLVDLIVQKRQAREITERCNTELGPVVNKFSIDVKSGRIIQSRQWAGPQLGYLDLKLVAE